MTAAPVTAGRASAGLVARRQSWRGIAGLSGGLSWWRCVAWCVLVGAIVLSVVSWYNTGYHVVGRELRIHEGLLWRRTRAIPLERLQAVEVVRPLLAQLTGLAELRLEVVGGGKTEAPLAYLTVRRGGRAAERCWRWPAGTAPRPAAGDAAAPPRGAAADGRRRRAGRPCTRCATGTC